MRNLRTDRVSVGAWVLRYAGSGLLVTAGLALCLGLLAQRAAAAHAADNFDRVARVSALALAPFLDAGSATGSAALGRQVDALHRSAGLVRVDVRDASGAIVWSDQPGMTRVSASLASSGSPGGAGPAPSVVRTGAVDNPYGGSSGSFLRAEIPVRDIHGVPLTVVLFQREAVPDPVSRETWLLFAPAALGAVLLLHLVQMSLGWRQAVRLRRARDAEGHLVRAAGDAAAAERRAIAAQVHDHVVQDLSGLAYDLDVARLRARERGGDDVPLLSATATGLRQAVSDLRALLVSHLPGRVPEGGLGEALEALAANVSAAGVEVRLDASGAERLPGAAGELLYRCAQEALRNVTTHSGATTVLVALRCERGQATMTIDDDGCGFDAGCLAERHAAGHLGLRALGDQLADASGSLTAASAPGSGTRLVATLPVALLPVAPLPVAVPADAAGRW